MNCVAREPLQRKMGMRNVETKMRDFVGFILHYFRCNCTRWLVIIIKKNYKQTSLEGLYENTHRQSSLHCVYTKKNPYHRSLHNKCEHRRYHTTLHSTQSRYSIHEVSLQSVEICHYTKQGKQNHNKIILLATILIEILISQIHQGKSIRRPSGQRWTGFGQVTKIMFQR